MLWLFFPIYKCKDQVILTVECNIGLCSLPFSMSHSRLSEISHCKDYLLAAPIHPEYTGDLKACQNSFNLYMAMAL